MINTSYLILGKAGVGKSTLINELTGTDAAEVSDAMHRDGTAKATQVLHKGIRFIDTVGLDSRNHNVSKSELCKLLRAPGYEHVTIVLVSDGSRMTTWTEEFLKLLDFIDIVGPGVQVIVYLHTSVESFDTKVQEFITGVNDNRCTFTFAKTVSEIRVHMPAPTLRNVLKPASATIRPAPSVRPPSQGKAAKAGSWFTRQLYYWNPLVAATPVATLSKVDAEIILKYLCEADIIKEVDNKEFQDLAFIGDRHLSDVLARIEYQKKGIDIVDRVPEMVKDQHLADIFDHVLRQTCQNARSRDLATAKMDFNAGSKGDFIEAALFLMLIGPNKADRASYVKLITRIRSL